MLFAPATPVKNTSAAAATGPKQTSEPHELLTRTSPAKCAGDPRPVSGKLGVGAMSLKENALVPDTVSRWRLALHRGNHPTKQVQPGSRLQAQGTGACAASLGKQP